MNFTYIEARFLKNIIIIILNLNKESDSIGLEKLVDSQAPETSWAPGTRCARSGQVIVRSLQNFHGHFRRCLQLQITIDLCLKLF